MPARPARWTSGSAGGPKPWFIMRWEGTDLGRLPEVLEQKICDREVSQGRGGRLRFRQPGAGLTTYKIAVMLY